MIRFRGKSWPESRVDQMGNIVCTAVLNEFLVILNGFLFEHLKRYNNFYKDDFLLFTTYFFQLTLLRQVPNVFFIA